MEERRSRVLSRAFRLSLDRLGITPDANKRRRVAREMARLQSGPLPGQDDYETLIPHGAGVGWAREIRELHLWLVYRFDDEELEVLVLVDRQLSRSKRSDNIVLQNSRIAKASTCAGESASTDAGHSGCPIPVSTCSTSISSLAREANAR